MPRPACRAKEVWGARSYMHLCTQHGVSEARYTLRTLHRRCRLAHKIICSSMNDEQLCQAQPTALAHW